MLVTAESLVFDFPSAVACAAHLSTVAEKEFLIFVENGELERLLVDPDTQRIREDLIACLLFLDIDADIAEILVHNGIRSPVFGEDSVRGISDPYHRAAA